MQTTRVNVLGSANMDLVVRTSRFPLPGETILGGSFTTFPGGKGANQGVAIGKLGGKPRFIGMVGRDAYGKQLRDSLLSAGVDVSLLLENPAEPTGVALITVEGSGENMIIVASGANLSLSPTEVLPMLRAHPATVLLCQLEIPLSTVTAAAKEHSGIFVLNPAPGQQLPNELLEHVDVIIPNQTETQVLTGLVPTDQASCREAAGALQERGVKNVAITMGADGCYVKSGGKEKWIPAFEVASVDSTAAGDAFSGALAHCLARGDDLFESARFASAVAALSTTRHGAQASMPSQEEVEAFLSPFRAER